MAYSEKVLDHYENPRNVGSFEKGAVDVFTGMVGAPACGDVMKLQLKISDEGVIQDAKFKTYGCLIGSEEVNTPVGLVRISELKSGQKVIAWNGEKLVHQKINKITVKKCPIEDLRKVTLKFHDPSGDLEFNSFNMLTTNDHLFWTKEEKPIEADDLVSDLELANLYCYQAKTYSLKVIQVGFVVEEDLMYNQIEEDGSVLVYDLSLPEGGNIYFSSGVASHNCGSAIASSSLVTEWVKGKTIEEALSIKNTQIAEELALPPVKIHCSILAEDAIKSAIADYKNKLGV